MTSTSQSTNGAALPSFSTHEVLVEKRKQRNSLVFSVPQDSSLLLSLQKPRGHAYEERDLRWLHLLQSVACVPSRKLERVEQIIEQARVLMPNARFRQRLEQLMSQVRGRECQEKETSQPSPSVTSVSRQALLALKLKEAVGDFLREWSQDPVEGCVLRKHYVYGDLRLDDLVATPVGAGFLRGYRAEDQFFIVLYPWGHGFIHQSRVQKLDQAIEEERRKRKWNQFLVLEHQHLYEDIESFLDTCPSDDQCVDLDGQSPVVTTNGINIEEYQKLLESLKDEEHFDEETLQHDLSILRRTKFLATKTQECQTTRAHASFMSTTASSSSALAK